MTDFHNIESTVKYLEGASNALWNFAQSDELTIEVVYGLQWLARQFDHTMVELRDKWDKMHVATGGSEA